MYTSRNYRNVKWLISPLMIILTAIFQSCITSNDPLDTNLKIYGSIAEPQSRSEGKGYFERGDAIGICVGEYQNVKYLANADQISFSCANSLPISLLGNGPYLLTAYYPYSEAADTSEGINFDITQDSDCDFLFASSVVENNVATLRFSHSMSRLNIDIDLSKSGIQRANDYKVIVNTIVEGVFDTTTGIIQLGNKVSPIVRDYSIEGHSFILPPGKHDIKIKFTNNDDYYSCEIIKELQPGQSYNYTLHVNKGIEIGISESLVEETE